MKLNGCSRDDETGENDSPSQKDKSLTLYESYLDSHWAPVQTNKRVGESFSADRAIR